MSLVLDPPIWYSKDEMYVSNVKESDLFVISDPVDLSVKGSVTATTPDINDELKNKFATLICTGTTEWFTTPVKAASILKRLKFEFIPLEHAAESKWVKIQWAPKHLQIKSKGNFIVLFAVNGFLDSNPRIPSSFLGSMTPRATTPTEEVETAEGPAEAPTSVQNTVVYPTEPEGIELVTNLAISEAQGDSIELRSAKQMSERQRLRQAKLRSAIARLKVEELRENYLRRYGDEDYSEDENSSDESVESEDLP